MYNMYIYNYLICINYFFNEINGFCERLLISVMSRYVKYICKVYMLSIA